MGWWIVILPVSGLVSFGFQRISIVADHYHYFAMFFVGGIVVWLSRFLDSRLQWQQVTAIGLAILIIPLTLLSHQRVQAWSSNWAFYSDMAITAPEDYSTALGLSAVYCDTMHDYQEGLKWVEKALEKQPLDILALANQAYCNLHAKEFKRVIDVEHYLAQIDAEKAIREQPTGYASILTSLGMAYFESDDAETALQYFCDSARIMPSYGAYLKNVQIVQGILRQRGLPAECLDPDEPGEESPSENVLEFLEGIQDVE